MMKDLFIKVNETQWQRIKTDLPFGELHLGGEDAKAEFRISLATEWRTHKLLSLQCDFIPEEDL